MPSFRFFRVLLLLPLWAAALSGRAQSAEADSLRRLLATAPPDTSRVLLLDELCWQLNRTDLPAALRYGREGLTLARRLGFHRGEAVCLNDLGTAALYAGDLPGAARYYQRGVAPARGHHRLLSFLYTGLGNVAAQQQDFPRAARYHRAALAELARVRPAPAPPDLALIYTNLADLYRRWNRPDSAQLRQRQALAVYRQAGYLPGQAMSLVNLGSVHQQQGRLDSAQLYFRQALRLDEQLGDLYGQARDLINLFAPLYDQGRYAEAAGAARRALALARRAEVPRLEAQALGNLAEAEAALGRHAQAYALQRRYQFLQDTLLSEEKNQALSQLQVRFDVDRQQQHIRELTQQSRLQQLQAAQQQARTRLFGALAGGLGLALAVFGIFYWQLRRSRRRLAESEAAARSAAEEARAANRTKDQLLAVIGHDLRGPVGSFQDVGELLRHYLQAGELQEVAGLGRELDQASQQLGALLDNLLQWAQSQTGALLVRPEPLPLHQAAEQALQLYRPAAAAKKLTLTNTVPAGLEVQADSNLLQTVLRNLLGNAIKFTPEGGTVSITTGLQAGQVSVAVADTGVGMTPEQQARLFAFDRRRSTRGTAGEGGTGLGLLVSQEFVQRLGGALRAQSAVGQGTTFSFELPAVNLTPSPSPAERGY
ncbi:hypothetical protein GCM10023185_13560 [Hymenobacter saemangeumensis]|uniref:histidine kinase n=1 Tax=Hymenobacter saemangeumensis TaxID=1084522 RepID=A0ABP8I7S3_9BACT